MLQCVLPILFCGTNVVGFLLLELVWGCSNRLCAMVFLLHPVLQNAKVVLGGMENQDVPLLMSLYRARNLCGKGL